MINQLAQTAFNTAIIRGQTAKDINHLDTFFGIFSELKEFREASEVEGGVHSGGRHIRPRGFLNDMEKYNTAATMGWRVLRTTPDELRTFKTIEMIKEAMSYGKQLQEGKQASD